jgi:hypothetical protein
MNFLSKFLMNKRVNVFIEKSIFATGGMESFGQLRMNRMTEKDRAERTVSIIKKACFWCAFLESIERVIETMIADLPFRVSLIKP